MNYTNKRNKRRTKAMRAKIARMKTAELKERLQMCKADEPKSYDDSDLEKYVEDCPAEEKSMCLDAVKMAIGILAEEDDDNQSTKMENTSKPPDEDWKSIIQNLEYPSSTVKGLSSDFTPNISDVDSSIKYLEGLLGLIVSKYKEIWHMDKPQNQAIKFDPIISLDAHLEQLQIMEKKQLRIVFKEFHNLTRNIKEAFEVDQKACQNILKTLERLLLTHNIRGQRISNFNTDSVEVIKLAIKMSKDFDKSLTPYLEKALADEVDDEELEITVKEHVTDRNRADKKSMGDYLYQSNAFDLPKSDFSENCSLSNCDISNHQTQIQVDSDVESQWAPSPLICFLEDMEKQGEHSCCFKECGNMKNFAQKDQSSKWTSVIESLIATEDYQLVCCNFIRIETNFEKRTSRMLFPNGNFSLVEVGLDCQLNPLVVRTICKSDPFAISVKIHIEPLLKLRHQNILHYLICDYHDTSLMVATPLCEFNLGQYILRMRSSAMHICKVNVIKQLLIGIKFLHDHDEAIVHGNLKPSNVLIDINGTVKVAEFGIHKALLQKKRLPESSIIWFATEIYHLYKQGLVPECTCASDIQVAGMLVHFAVSCGSHPFGKDVANILDNLEKARTQFSTVVDIELHDLLMWMLLGNPSQRPNMHKVLSHIYFWPKQKKWAYILLCAGLSVMGSIPMDVEKLHTSLDKIAIKENITGNCWVLTARKEFPYVDCLSNFNDTPSGLLKFIKSVIEGEVPGIVKGGGTNFGTFIMNSFPHFVLSLYRMIENTEWSDHRVFMPFHSVLEN